MKRLLSADRWPRLTLGLAAFWLGLALAVPAQQPVRTGKLTGRVLAEDGQPLANATVRIHAVGVTRSGVARTATTDEEGNFVFELMPPASYRFEVTGRDYVTPPEAEPPRTYRLGEHATLNLVKGGIIAGRVTNALGEPVVAIEVTAIRLRDAQGQRVEPVLWPISRLTDDRGQYRLYGLLPGTYVVGANELTRAYAPSNGYEGETPIFYPAETRVTATELTVRPGEELSGIDIRYRSERGRTLSGKLTGALNGNADEFGMFTVQLNLLPLGVTVAETFVNLERAKGFSLYGLPEGEYEISARGTGSTGPGALSKPKRVSLRGADVSGLELLLEPLAMLSGRIALEKLEPAAGKCPPTRPLRFEELLIQAQPSESVASANTPATARKPLPGSSKHEAAPGSQGEFTLRGLFSGVYRLITNLPNSNLYLKEIKLGAEAKSRASTQPRASITPSVDLGRNGIALQAGEKISGVTLTIAEGAASVQGKVSGLNAADSAWKVHLIPAEAAQADDVIRYAETRLQPDGSFAFVNLAPGKYWVLVQPEVKTNQSDQPLAWRPLERANLRRAAEAAKQEIELVACQKLMNFEVVANRNR